MTACTQPGCTGTIVDDYCNVCGSPAGAPPFVPAGAAASAPSAALAVGSGLTAGRQRPEFPPPPQDGGFMTACTQPGCTGTIVDDYCNVCGSPAGAPPFVPAGAAASAPPAALAVGTGLTAGRRGVLAAVRRGVGVAVVLFLLGCAVVFYRVAPGIPTSGSGPITTASTAPTRVGTQSVTPGGQASSAGRSPASDPRSGSAAEETIQLEDLADSARPFEAVRIQGTYRGGAGSFLRVQRWEGGKWLDFPVTYEDRPVGTVHHPGRVWAAGSLLASRAGPRLRRDVQALCAGDQGLIASVCQPPGPRTASSLAKTTMLSRYLCLAAS